MGEAEINAFELMVKLKQANVKKGENKMSQILEVMKEQWQKLEAERIAAAARQKERIVTEVGFAAAVDSLGAMPGAPHWT